MGQKESNIDRRQFLAWSAAGGAVGLDRAIFGLSGFSPLEAMAAFQYGQINPLEGSPALLQPWLKLSVEADPFLSGFAEKISHKLESHSVKSLTGLIEWTDKTGPRFSLRDPIKDRLMALSYVGWYGGHDAKLGFPNFLSDNRFPIREKGEVSIPFRGDKSIHFLANALSSYVRFRDLYGGMFAKSSMRQFVNGVEKIKEVIGLENYSKVKERIKSGEYFPAVTMKVFGVSAEEQKLFESLFDMGLIFEIITSYPEASAWDHEDKLIGKNAKDLALDRLINGGVGVDQFIRKLLELRPDINVFTGLNDSGVTYDLLADMLGVTYGYLSARHAVTWENTHLFDRAKLSAVPVPNDDHHGENPYPLPNNISGVMIENGAARLV